MNVELLAKIFCTAVNTISHNNSSLKIKAKNALNAYPLFVSSFFIVLLTLQILSSRIFFLVKTKSRILIVKKIILIADV